MPLRPVTQKTPSLLTTKTSERPAPVRANWELEVAWKTLHLVEADASSRQGVGTLKEALVPGWGTNQFPAVNDAFRALSPDLKRFVAEGASSLTPYEATRIAFGLGLGGTYHVEPSEKAKGYVRGDRVELKVTHDGKTQTTKGIVVPGGVLAVDSGNRLRFYAPEFDNGTQGRDKVTITRVLAGALNDGTLEAKYR